MTYSAAAVDLGATSGRVMLGRLSDGRVSLHEITRFPNVPRDDGASLRWNVRELYTHIVDGLRRAVREDPALSSAAIDSWGVDYGLVRGDRLVDDPYHYRDARTTHAAEQVHQTLSPTDLFRRTGIQPMSINTLYQLHDDRRTGRLAGHESVVMIPNLIEYWLTGVRRVEVSMASTTGLLGTDGEWDLGLVSTLGIPGSALPGLVRPGTEQLPVLDEFSSVLGRAMVTSIASHDTASAVAATPLPPDSAYISCGTWGLAGVELPAPLLDDDARASGFTNERGRGGVVCFQRNLMGLWLLTECISSWSHRGATVALPDLLAEAGQQPHRATFDVNDAAFGRPGDMPGKITRWYREHDLDPPRTPASFVRCIVDSLADSFADAVAAAARLSGRVLRRIYLVGGGSRNVLLCQAIADRTGLPVLAGLPEATAIGNVLTQAAVQGRIGNDTESIRAVVRRSYDFTGYQP
jgi:rhamnulokinase